jgi:hypothetical protein
VFAFGAGSDLCPRCDRAAQHKAKVDAARAARFPAPPPFDETAHRERIRRAGAQKAEVEVRAERREGR